MSEGQVPVCYGALPPQDEAVRLFCGVCEDNWNGLAVEAGPFACISPVYGHGKEKRVNPARLSPATLAVTQDSGAFCDGPGQRLTFAEALRRQVHHADQQRYAERITHRASYDLLLLPRAISRHFSERETLDACLTTIQAARFLSAHREGLACILTAQGATPAQYLQCAQGIVPLLQPGDFFGLGGWGLLGLKPSRLPLFRETLRHLVPFLTREGVWHLHLWGCLFAPALGELLWWADRSGLTLSTDSVGPSLRPVFGRWGYASWCDPRYRRPTGARLGRDRRLHAALTRCWLSHLREREARWYRCSAG